MKKLGIYIHVPYCIQRCSYCDFATYEKTQILPPPQYVDLILKEIQLKHAFFEPRKLTSIYFGGGTPSLIDPLLLNQILKNLQSLGYAYDAATEVTLEINPATLSQGTLRQYLDFGFNRFSVGAQTFNDPLLKKLGREHSSLDTLQTLEILAAQNTNYSLDLLFALPQQNTEQLKSDLDQIIDASPSHVSAYCLTLNEGHPLNQNRPEDEFQIEMFHLIRQRLLSAGLHQYEISNYARSGKESQHNLLYWTDQEYWGIGLGAHSYSKHGPYGTRFWNDRSIIKYEEHTRSLSSTLNSPQQLSSSLWESLNANEALTDFCHTSLRTSKGLSFNDIIYKFSPAAAENVLKISGPLIQRGLLVKNETAIALSSEGQLISNQVFEEFTFLGLTT